MNNPNYGCINNTNSSKIIQNIPDGSIRGMSFETMKKLDSFANNTPIREDNHKQLLENFRDIIDKIDDKIYGQYQKTATETHGYKKSYPKENHENNYLYKTFEAEKPLNTYN